LDTRRWNLAHGRVTISTVGLVSQIRKLTAELPHVSLALSLHAPNQAMREQIVPTANRYPIADLIDALDNHMQTYLNMKFNGREYTAADRIKESTRRRAMIEYVMLEGPTSTFESAHELGALCKDRALVVNLIPYNATDVQDELKCPSEEHMQEFRRIVASYNTFCTVRRTMGADIDSACGQLLIKEGANAGNNNKTIVDIEDVVKSDTKPKKTVRLNLKRHTLTSDDKRKLEKWIQPLAFATAAAFSCFLVSAVHYIRQRRR
jgi:adenine C2-methylase RlmN of 23S rRNA A2503 and tRNA A37